MQISDFIREPSTLQKRGKGWSMSEEGNFQVMEDIGYMKNHIRFRITIE